MNIHSLITFINHIQSIITLVFINKLKSKNQQLNYKNFINGFEKHMPQFKTLLVPGGLGFIGSHTLV
jgi:hypothetical protein